MIVDAISYLGVYGAIAVMQNLEDESWGDRLLKHITSFESIFCWVILRSPQLGSLRILNTELVGAAKSIAVEARRSCGYIFQAHNLHSSLTAQENVMMGLEMHGVYPRHERRDRAVQMLELVGLEERTQYYADNLSGGQKQRVAIARALVSHPQIVLADEPTAALDKQSGRDVVNIMQKLAREQGCTILMVTHDNRILDIADRIVYMEDGCLADHPVAAIVH